MKFISQYLGFRTMIFPEQRKHIVERGQPIEKITENCVMAEFRTGGLTEWEVKQAVENFGRIKGLPDDVPVSTRLSYYDTNEMAHLKKWSPEYKEEVEKSLLEKMGNGRYYFLSESIPIIEPFPGYDNKDDPAKVAFLAKELNCLVESLEYEKENRNRSEFIEAMEAELDEVVVSA